VASLTLRATVRMTNATMEVTVGHPGGRRGVIAAGHPVTAQTGADVLRAGGNAVDAAVAAMLASFAAEPMLTGLGAGGYMLVARPDEDPVLLDFFAAAPGQGADVTNRAPLVGVDVSFGDAVQLFHVGPASCAVYGAPAGAAAAIARFGTVPMAELTKPAAALARNGVRVNREQAYIWSLLIGILESTPESRAHYLIDGRTPLEGEVLTNLELADTLDRLGAEGAAPFYIGNIGAAISDWVCERGGTLTRQDLASYEVITRQPIRVAYRGRDVYTNPPPSAGGKRLADALELLGRTPGPPPDLALGNAFASSITSNPLGSTTHISVLDESGWACAVTCTNGEGSGVVVPGTGVHVNNMMGEEGLSPDGFFSHPPGARLPSMMAPTVVVHDGVPELVLGSAGSNRICSALLQVVVNVVDRGMDAQEAIDAPRLHVEDRQVYAEPGIDVVSLEAAGYAVTQFRSRNLFFGGCQAVQRQQGSDALTGGADPRRGGAVVVL
jgi:gamma-glutamyltranspeptidase / glutathione hydrolase